MHGRWEGDDGAITKPQTLTFELLLVLFTGSVVHAESPATELSPVEVPHGTEGGLLVLIFTKAIPLGLTRLPVIHQSTARGGRVRLPVFFLTRRVSGADHTE